MKSNSAANKKRLAKAVILTALAAMAAISCNRDGDKPDAWGNFEATETLVSSTQAGEIMEIFTSEGDKISSGDPVAIIDTTPVFLQIRELLATRESVKSKIVTINSQSAIYLQQVDNMKSELERVSKLLEDDAATEKQFDDLSGQVKVLTRQAEATEAQKLAVMSELAVIDARHTILKESLARCYISSPAAGTVIGRYSEPGEITAPGRPVIKIADMDRIRLKVYVSGADLSKVIIGNTCQVRIDGGENEYIEYTGRIIIVSDRAEFTPKIIQTREERVSLVYAVTIEVQNDGRIKSGMPGEAIF